MSDTKYLPESEWKWFGNAGHFICSEDCGFRLCTVVGDYIISTVGELALKDLGPQYVGWNRKYETMVFQFEGYCDCTDDCGLPKHNGSELEMEGYQTRAAAQSGHLAMCQRYAAITANP